MVRAEGQRRRGRGLVLPRARSPSSRGSFGTDCVPKEPRGGLEGRTRISRCLRDACRPKRTANRVKGMEMGRWRRLRPSSRDSGGASGLRRGRGRLARDRRRVLGTARPLAGSDRLDGAHATGPQARGYPLPALPLSPLRGDCGQGRSAPHLAGPDAGRPGGHAGQRIAAEAGRAGGGAEAARPRRARRRDGGGTRASEGWRPREDRSAVERRRRSGARRSQRLRGAGSAPSPRARPAAPSMQRLASTR